MTRFGENHLTLQWLISPDPNIIFITWAIGGSVATTVAGWLGIPIATTVTVVTTPVWAVPVAVAGGVLALGSIVFWAHKKLKKKQMVQLNS